MTLFNVQKRPREKEVPMEKASEPEPIHEPTLPASEEKAKVSTIEVKSEKQYPADAKQPTKTKAPPKPVPAEIKSADAKSAPCSCALQ